VAARIHQVASQWSAASVPGSSLPSGVAASVRGASRAFGPRTVLDGLDLDIAEGEFVALRELEVGPAYAVSAVKLVSIALILAGVVGLNLSGVTP